MDFDLLVEIIGRFAVLMVTPNIVTETSNLLRFGSQDERLSLALATGLQEWVEVYRPSRSAVQHRAYARLGLSDVVMLDVLKGRDDTILLTADVDLYIAGQYEGLQVENFNHIRDGRNDFR